MKHYTPRIETKSPHDLTPYFRNTKAHPTEQIDKIASAIAEFGFDQPIVIDSDGVIIKGHGRREAAIRLGIKEVPVLVRDDLTEAQKKAARIADNKVAESEWLQEELKTEIEELSDLDYDLDLTGFGEDELDVLLDGFGDDEEGEEGDGDIDDVPDVDEVEPRVKLGEIWDIAGHRIMCGDCRNSNDVALLIGKCQINVAMTSPPYASQRKYDEESGFKPIHPDKYIEWFKLVQENIKKHLAKDGSYFLNIKEHCEDGQRHLYVKYLTIAHAKEWGWRFVDEFCWLRTSPPGKWNNRFKNGFEPVFHFCIEQKIKLNHEAVSIESDDAFLSSAGGIAFQKYHNHDRKDDMKKHENNGGVGKGLALPSNVVKASLGEVNIGTLNQPATYPVALPEFFIKAFTDEGDRVFDPFCGSGTTIVAAHQNNRIGLGMEISPKYCDIILARMEKIAGDTAKLIS